MRSRGALEHRTTCTVDRNVVLGPATVRALDLRRHVPRTCGG